MDKKKLLKWIICLMFSIYVFNLIGQKFHWDYTTWWFDMISHFSGGFWVSLFFIWFFSIKNLPFLKPTLDPNDPKLIHKAVCYILLIGLLWELFEFYANNYIGIYPFDIVDTSSDLFLDLAGGFLGLWYFSKKIMVSKENTVQ